jgi:hypothetical protein
VKEKIIMHRSIGFALALAAFASSAQNAAAQLAEKKVLTLAAAQKMVAAAQAEAPEHDVQIAQAGLAALGR